MKATLGSVALTVSALTLASRLLGFGRSVVFSKTVGDTCLGDVYNAANTLPNVLFEIVAGGVLAGVVVPVVARHAGSDRRSEASVTSSALMTWTVVILTPAAAVAFFGAGFYASVFSKANCPDSAATIAGLVVIFVPQVWLYGLAVVSAGILQAHHRFVAAALAPLLSSVVVIATYLAFASMAPVSATTDLTALSGRAAGTLGWGTTAGVLALAGTTMVALARLNIRIRPRLRFAPGDGAVIGTLALAGVAGLVIQQLSVLLISWTAQQSPEAGALTRFGWANAVYLLPYAVLVAPLLQMAFPRLSSAAEAGPAGVSTVLRTSAPPVVVAGSAGAALLVATAMPVARVFVLGPGAGQTEDLALPIVWFAPAVLGFALLGLASRALLAQHLARLAGTATVTAWTVVIVCVIVLRRSVSPELLVPALAAAVSIGMLAGATVSWWLLLRSLRLPTPAEPARVPRLWSHLAGPLRSSLVAAAVAGTLVGWLGQPFAEASLGWAVGGSVGTALSCLMIFVGVLWFLDRGLLRQVSRLIRDPSGPESVASASGSEPS